MLNKVVRISMLTAVSVAISTVGVSSAASAAGSDSAAALKVVPGLATAATTQTDTKVVGGGLGFQAATASGASVQITRVPETSSETAVKAGGQVTVKDTSRKTDTVVQQLPDSGGRIIEVMKSADAPSTFDYSIKIPQGAKTFEQTDGSILIGTNVNKGGTTTVQVDGFIAAPWAVDAKGVKVPASYDLQGGKLTMSVDESAVTAYPVVADPTYTKGGFKVVWTAATANTPTVYLNKARSEDFKNGNEAACIGLAFVPGIGAVMAAICAVNVIILGAAYRYGFCTKATFDILNRKVRTGVYKDSFCA